MSYQMSSKQHICVCICTYKRPGPLNILLRKLEELETEGLFDYSIVVVDNDIFESARLTVESHTNQSNINISYHVEPHQNIALARNKTIKNAKGDFVGFIDDDEFPDPRWLIKHYKAILHFESDGILGPVLPYYDVKPPNWVIDGHFFDRTSFKTGQILDWQNTRTGNALLRRDLFKDDMLWFQPSFGSGGEDRDFFKRMISEGHHFIWCAEAIVHEKVQPERWQIKVLIKRALLRGKMALNYTASNPKSLILSGLVVIVYTLSLPLLLALSPVLGFDIFMTYLIKNFDHLGKILAFFHIDPVREKYVS